MYTIDEQVPIMTGSYEGQLAHDNAINSTVKVYAGPMLSGEQITTWTLSTPSETPWRRNIRIFASVPVVYVSYETPGDQVDANDVNVLQTAITATQAEVERYKAEGVIDGGFFDEEM